MVTLKAVLVHAPDELRHAVARRTPVKLARHLAALRPRGLATLEDASRHTLRSLARRWQYLQEEAHELAEMIEELALATAPQLVEPFGIGVGTAADILIVAGDNPERIQSKAALAKLAGTSPIPASSGMSTGRHRAALDQLWRLPPAQRRHLPHRDRANALPRTDHHLRRPPHRRGKV